MGSTGRYQGCVNEFINSSPSSKSSSSSSSLSSSSSPSSAQEHLTMTSSVSPAAVMSAWFVTSLKTWSFLVVGCLIVLMTCSSGVRAQIQQRFLQEPESVSVTRGRQVVLRCKIANRVGMVQWTQNGVALGTDRALPGYPRYSMIGSEVNQSSSSSVGEWNLQIVDVSMDDDGHYQCQAGATHAVRGIRSRSASITVVVPPEPPTIDGAPTLPVELHKLTNVTCRANNGKPAADITWYVDDQRVIDNVFSMSHPRPDQKFVDSVGLMTINASKADSGRRLECRAKNLFMETPFSTFVTLDVQYAPEITMSVNISRTIREYDYVRFSCNGVANPADISWRWFRNGDPIEGETGNTLTVASLSYDYNSDIIACTATNSVDKTRQEMTLTVEYGPKITEADVVVGADLQGSAELSCTIDGNPRPHVVWTKTDSGSPAISQSPLSTEPTYTIDSVNAASFGVYTCTASSPGFPDASKDILLLQNAKPAIRSEKQQYASKGEEGQLECIARSVPKPDRIVWLRKGQPIPLTAAPEAAASADGSSSSSSSSSSSLSSFVSSSSTSDGRFVAREKDLLYGRSSVLTIASVRKEDFGDYMCNVINAYGTDNATLTLIEKTVPPLPYIVGGVVGGLAVLFIIAVACVLFQRYRRDDVGSVVGSTTDTDSSGDRKRKDADSPSTLMDQWRQDYNKPKDFYRHSADYDEVHYKDQHTGNNNAYGCLEPNEPHGRDHYTRNLTLDRYEQVYGPPAFSLSSFRGRGEQQPGYESTNVKLATDV